MSVALLAGLAAIIIVANRTTSCGEPGPRIEGTGVELLADADGYRVLVTSDNEFHVGALMWVLRIGNTELHRSSYPERLLNAIEFPIPPEALSRLRDGDTVGVFYGSPDFSQLSSDGSYSTVTIDGDRAESDGRRQEGLGTMRIPRECAPLSVARATRA